MSIYSSMNVVVRDVKQSLAYGDQLAAIENYRYGCGLEIPRSKYLPDSIREDSLVESWPTCTHENTLHGLFVQVAITTCTNDLPPHAEMRTIMAIILAAVSFCQAHASPTSLRRLSIIVALSHYRKEMLYPEIRLTPAEVNTGFTVSQTDAATIVVYRREEWFKVLLHECMHAFEVEPRTRKLDEAIGSEIGVEAFRFGEAYVEFWARVVNCAFAAVLHGYDSGELRRVMVEEQKYASSLVPALLQTYGLTTETLFSRKRVRLVEQSNVIAYYVICTVLLMDYVKVLGACGVGNRKNYLNYPESKTELFLRLVFSYKPGCTRKSKEAQHGLSLAMTTIRAVE